MINQVSNSGHAAQRDEEAAFADDEMEAEESSPLIDRQRELQTGMSSAGAVVSGGFLGCNGAIAWASTHAWGYAVGGAAGGIVTAALGVKGFRDMSRWQRMINPERSRQLSRLICQNGVRLATSIAACAGAVYCLYASNLFSDENGS